MLGPNPYLFLIFQCVLKDERVSACEALYTFLSPSSEHLKGTVVGCGLSSPKKARFSFSTLFKGSNPPGVQI